MMTHKGLKLLKIFAIIAGLLLATLLLFYLDEVARYSVDKSDVTEKAISTNSIAVSFNDQVKPILDKRCVVCHSCYDAPCQLKLSSVEGIARGANKEKVYNPRRLTALEPTRLFIDAKSTAEWRERNFHSVIDKAAEASTGDSSSLMQKLLKLKQDQPQAKSGKLSDDFSFEIDRDQICPTQESYNTYIEQHPLWGMPYAMPNLTQKENTVLQAWLENGAQMPAAEDDRVERLPQISAWERFLNQTSNKHRLVSRYIYEHLFHAHIHFADSPPREFYRLVRSRTPSGKTIDEIASLRPYDAPGVENFYYRLRRYTPTIVAKNHIVYELSEQRMQRYQALFIQPDYKVVTLPSYAPEVAANPFKAFEAIPPDSRYRFLLDEARFFIEGFIKGPVCRGQIALNVIEDQFWVVFFNPDQKTFTTQPSFLNAAADYLKIPSERGNHLNLLPIWTDYWQRQKAYMATKQRYFKNMKAHSLEQALDYIWDGQGENPNAALTVFRHFDSASVEYGLIGKMPETAWVIDYPLLERIHYLLVAGFDVYGNIGHQLSTRIYMDFLRMEGEDHFLAFLPASKRKAIRDSWYQGIRSELDILFKAPMDWLQVDAVHGYKTEAVQSELYQRIKTRMGNLLQRQEMINLCGKTSCTEAGSDAIKVKADKSMQKIANMTGMQLHDFPEAAFLRVTTDDPDVSFVYTIMRNKAYKNVMSLFSDERERVLDDIEQDSLTVVDWLAGSYPNFFFSVHEEDLETFVTRCSQIKNPKDFADLVERFGIRRTSPAFWKTADWFHEQYARQRPVQSGLYDLSRYGNL